MRRIIGIGETVLDIIFKNGQPQAAKAGGSMLNSVVSIGRMNLPVSFISEYALDDVGNLVDDFLKENGVDTSAVHRYRDGKTALALAFLNEKNDARYTFYKDYPPDRLSIRFPEAGPDDIILCGSFYSIWSEIREKFLQFIAQARRNGAIVIYDPNFRATHLFELGRLKPLILENMKLADIVRGSNEDFMHIFGAGNMEDAYNAVKPYCSRLVYTASDQGVYIRTSSFSAVYPVARIEPVSTIGAGDNFNAGMITSLYQQGIRKTQLDSLREEQWKQVAEMAVNFATHVCMSYENYISPAYAEEMRKKWG